MKKSSLLIAGAIPLLVAACANPFEPAHFPDQGSVLPYTVLTTLNNGTEVRNGGYGSAAAAHPTHKNRFYALTDRGPNADFKGSAGNGKKFPSPDYTPRIGEFEVKPDGRVVLIHNVLLKNPSGQAISGLPNPQGLGATGEVPYDNDGKVLASDPFGLDSEGLAAMHDGSFWVSDEYGPHIVHYAADGVELERMSPHGINTTGRKLPAVLARRWANRGMEGLTVTPDGKTLVGVMQSTLYNPTKKQTENFTLTRILTFDLASGKTHQYLYRQDKNKNANSEIAALSATTFLMIERDGKYSGKETAQKSLYKINLMGATDVSGDVASPDGLLINGKTLEASSWDAIEKAGIKPVEKELVADVVAQLPNHFPHDKLEGLWVMSPHTVGLLNDDDFAVIPEGDTVVQKKLPGAGFVDRGTLYILNLKKPLF